MSLLLPTRVMRPACTSTASARGCASFNVTSWAFVMARFPVVVVMALQHPLVVRGQDTSTRRVAQVVPRDTARVAVIPYHNDRVSLDQHASRIGVSQHAGPRANRHPPGDGTATR